MNSSLALRRRAKSAVLNPYVVVADFALSLMMIIIVYFLVTARVTEAIYASDQTKFHAADQEVPHLSTYYRKVVRNGPFLNYRFPNTMLFANAHLSPSGVEAMQGMAAVLKTSQCAPLVERVRLTVSYPAEWNVLKAQANADAIGKVLVASGVTCPIVTSARTQRDPWIQNKSEFASTEFSIQLKTPKSASKP